METEGQQNRNISGLIRFEPGKSGNPNGRPKGSRNRKTIVKKWLELEEQHVNPVTEQIEMVTQEDLITIALIRKARGGDVAAYTALMNSCYGAPKPEGIDNEELNNIIVRIV